MFEQFGDLQHGIIAGIAAVDSRNFPVRVPQQRVAAGNVQAAVEDLGQVRFAQLAQGRAADACAVQNRFDRAAAHRRQFVLCFQQQAGVFHRVVQHALQPLVRILAAQGACQRVVFVQRDDLQLACRLTIPVGACLHRVQEGKKFGFVRKRSVEDVCIGRGFIHGRFILSEFDLFPKAECLLDKNKTRTKDTRHGSRICDHSRQKVAARPPKEKKPRIGPPAGSRNTGRTN